MTRALAAARTSLLARRAARRLTPWLAVALLSQACAPGTLPALQPGTVAPPDAGARDGSEADSGASPAADAAEPTDATSPADASPGPADAGADTDLCPDDPDKLAPGRCGCGVPEDRCAEPCDSALARGERLGVGESVCAADGRFRFGLDATGDLVLTDHGQPRWQAGIEGGTVLVMQGDGNLVVYDAGGQPLFASNTQGNSGAVLTLRPDGNAVVERDGAVLWETGAASD